MENFKMAPASFNIDNIAWDCKNDLHQCLNPQGASQQVLDSPADASRLVSGSPSPMAHMLLNLVFLSYF